MSGFDFPARHAAVVDFLKSVDFGDSEEARRFPDRLLSDIAGFGVFGLLTPARDGGLGLGLHEAACLIRSIAAFDMSLASAIAIHNFLALTCIETRRDTPEFAAILAEAVSGRALCAFALTEPGAGSAPRSIVTEAVLENGTYRISGKKIWIGLADYAEWLVVFCKIRKPGAASCFGSLLVNRKTPGVHMVHEHRTSGLRGIVQNTVVFEACEVPATHLLCHGESSWMMASGAMNRGRVGVGAISMGVLERAIQIAATYVGQRRLNGTPLISNSYICGQLDDAIRQREILVAYLEAATSASGDPDLRETLAMTFKVVASEWAGTIIDRCVQMMGGRGFDDDLIVSRFQRDVRIARIFEGPTETLLAHLGRSVASRAARATLLKVFEHFGAADIFADICQVIALDSEKRSDRTIPFGWLVCHGLVLAIVDGRRRPDEDAAQFEARRGFAAACYQASRRRCLELDQTAPSGDPDAAKIHAFLGEIGAALGTPALDQDFLKVRGFR